MATDVSSAVKFFPKPQEGFTTTTSGSVSSGATSVGLSGTGNYTNGDVVVLIIEPGVSGKEQSFTGTVDTGGSQITGVKWTSGTNSAHSGGVTVVDYVAAAHIQLISTGLLVEHDQDGTHGNITGATLDLTGAASTDTINEHTSASGVTIDSLQIKDAALVTANSVITNNITADAVTDSKLIYGKIRSRQGGSSTVWSGVGTTNYDYSATNTFMQVGATQGLAGSDVTVTFPTAFNQTPIVIGSDLVTSSNCTFIVVTVSATNFTFRMVDTAGTQRDNKAGWIAVGE